MVQINLTNQILQDKDILEGCAELQAELKRVMNRFAFTVLYVNAAALVFALPIILVRGSVFVESVIAPGRYLTLVPFMLLICFIIYKGGITLARDAGWFEKEDAPTDFCTVNMAALNRIQGGVIVLALFFSLLGVMSSLWPFPFIPYLALGGFLVTLAAVVIILIVFVIKAKKTHERLLVLAAGIRNIAYGFAGILTVSGITIWTRLDGTATFGQYHVGMFYWGSLLAVGTTGLYFLIKKFWF